MAGEDRQNQKSGGDEAEPEEKTDGWLTTYSDLVTLLLTFFVLLFAISNVDSQKMALVFAGMSRDGLTAEVFQEIVDRYGPIIDPSTDPDDTMFPLPPASPSPEEPDVSDSAAIGNEQLTDLLELLDKYIVDNGYGDRMSLVFDGEFLLLTLANEILFVSGSADITDSMRETGSEIAHLLGQSWDDDNPFQILVSGHTDNVPVNTARYPNNWYVSRDRANNFLEILLNESGIDPNHFAAQFCGEYRPVASNDTAEGRRANRRVEVQIGLARKDGRWDMFADEGS